MVFNVQEGMEPVAVVEEATKAIMEITTETKKTLCSIGQASKEVLEAGDPEQFAALMHDPWIRKRERSVGMTNDMIDRWYQRGIDNGALGGKLVGAGAGGFLLFYARDPSKLRKAMTAEGLTEVRFLFDHDGSVVLSRD